MFPKEQIGTFPPPSPLLDVPSCLNLSHLQVHGLHSIVHVQTGSVD